VARDLRIPRLFGKEPQGLVCASALAADDQEERGLVPSVVPPAPDESGRVNNVPAWRDEFEEAAVLAKNERRGGNG